MKFGIGLALLLCGHGLVIGQQEKRAAVKDNTQFAFDLYGKLRGREGNLFLSPFSISTALAMTYGGARGQTAREMADVLHFGADQERLHAQFAALLADLNRGDPKKRGYELALANALWVQKNFGLLPDFINLIRDSYHAGLNEVDFVSATEEARRTINSWVEEKTRQKIKDLLKPGILSSDTRLVLTNAIYFKGLWARPFKKNLTHEEIFKTSDNAVKAPFMHQKGRFKHLEGDGFQALELPYQGSELAMTIFLPDKADGLARFEQSLTAARLQDWLGKMHAEEVQVALPRFKLTAEFNLNDTLKSLGMRQAFVSGAADFSGISGSENKLFIAAVVHKAFVDVNEEGTEAAASTGAVISLTSALGKTFRADHPFLFLIRDVRTGSVLFLGRLSKP